MQTSRAGKPRNKKTERGFTYVMALAAILLVSILAGVASTATSRIVQAEREEELIFRGMAYTDAIQRYYSVAKRYPRSLDQLLKDPRFAHRRYLRAPYPDPMTPAQAASNLENGGWRLVRAADGGIAGVVSASSQEPLKKANFPPGLEKFEGAKSYSDWIFEYAPRPNPAGTATADVQ